MNNKPLYLGILVFGILLFQQVELFGQERLGLRMDNYQGINSIFINPSMSSTQALPWNLNIISAGGFVENDFGFLENSSFNNAFKKTIISRDNQPDDAQIDLDEFVVLDFNNKDSRKFAEVNAFITGPSFMAHMDKHHFGAFINYRFHIAEQNLEEELGYYTNQRLAESIDLGGLQAAGAGWREIGAHYAYASETSFGHISVGANFKYLTGYEVIAFETAESTRLTRLSPDVVEAETVDISLIATTAVIDLEDFASEAKGSGFGLDFGVSVVFDDYEDDYKLKLGLAVNDIGSIAFDTDIEGHRLQATNPTSFDKQNYLELTGIRDLVSRGSQNVLNDPNASLDTGISTFDLRLPTSIVLNADYKIMDRVYVGGLIVQRLPRSKVGLEKSNLVGIFPRYESKWLGASLPITMINYRKAHVGLSLRLAYLTIGTDQLGTLRTRKELTGGDAYISLQFFGFNNDGLFNRIFQKSGGKATKCYEM